MDADTEYDEESEVLEVEEEQVEQQLYVLPSPDVSTWVRFLGVENEGTRFQAGNEVVALIGMHNSGDKTFNVSFVGAHLHSPYDQSFFVQNMTGECTATAATTNARTRASAADSNGTINE